MIKTFEDIECWKFPVELRRTVSSLVKDFSKEEKYLLTDQLKRRAKTKPNRTNEPEIVYLHD